MNTHLSKQSGATYKSGWDRVGIAVASLCMIHCILLPLLLTTLPLLGFEILENPYIELATLLTAFFAGGWTIYRGYKRFHHQLSIVVMFITGLAVIAVANFIETEWLEMSLKGVGAILIIIAHIRNWRQCRCHSCTVCQQ